MLREFQPDRVLGRSSLRFTSGDSWLPQEWWLARVGADRAEPPGPGKPVTVIDSGLDMAHPEFAARPNTSTLNGQAVGAGDESHGTAVSSMIAAPANGIGLVGVYPDAQLYSFDAGQLTVSSIIGGLDRAALLGRGVVNLSFGKELRLPLEEHVLLDAYDRGLIVVAAAGNSGEVGSPTEYPAYFPHVLTVAATDINDEVADFSTRSTAIDLAAPGHEVPVAVAGGGYDVWSGTSFAAPIVSGAAAWLWTARPELDKTQVMEILRRSARDIGAPGRDSDSGHGILDIPGALALPAPIADPLEPNDDVDMIVAGGMFGRGKAALTGKGRPRAELEARLDVAEDPEDVYSVWVGPGQRVTATLTAPSRVDLELWKPGTRSVYVKGWERKQNLAASNTRSGAGVRTVAAINRTRRGAYFYVDAFLPEGSPVRAESYKLSITTGR